MILRFLFLFIILSGSNNSSDYPDSNTQSFRSLKRSAARLRKIRFNKAVKAIDRLNDIRLKLNYKYMVTKASSADVKIVNKDTIRTFKQLRHLDSKLVSDLMTVAKKDPDQLKGLNTLLDIVVMKLNSKN